LNIVVTRAEELADWRRARSVDQAGIEVDEHGVGHVFAVKARVKHFDAAELRIIVAALLTANSDAAVVAQHLAKLDAHLATAPARLQLKILRKETAFRREARGIKRAGRS
jgi:hypothetical protein